MHFQACIYGTEYLWVENQAQIEANSLIFKINSNHFVI